MLHSDSSVVTVVEVLYEPQKTILRSIQLDIEIGFFVGISQHLEAHADDGGQRRRPSHGNGAYLFTHPSVSIAKVQFSGRCKSAHTIVLGKSDAGGASVFPVSCVEKEDCRRNSRKACRASFIWWHIKRADPFAVSIIGEALERSGLPASLGFPWLLPSLAQEPDSWDSRILLVV